MQEQVVDGSGQAVVEGGAGVTVLADRGGQLLQAARRTVDALALMDREALVAETGEQLIGGRDALTELPGDFVGTHPLGVLQQQSEDAQHRPGGAEAAAGRSNGHVRKDACGTTRHRPAPLSPDR
jgi:hypothetical protein